MLKECIIWCGIYTATYQDELDEWVQLPDDLDTTIIHASDVTLDEYDSFYDDTGGIFSDKTLLILNAEVWDAATAQWVLKKFKDMSTEVRIGLVYQGKDPTAKVVSYATEDVRERRIPFDSDAQAQWIVTWLRTKSILIDIKDAKAVAEHVRYDVGKLVRGLLSIITGRTGRITKSDIIELLGDLGETDTEDLANSILNGDRSATAEAYQRLAHLGDYYLFNMMSRKFRIIAALAFNRNVDLEQFKVYGGAQYYAKREAILNQKLAISALRAISTADSKMRGGSTLPASEVVSTMFDSLAIICNRASR